MCTDDNLVDNRDNSCPQSALVGALGSRAASSQSRLRMGLALIVFRFYSLQD
jgi:hypothetical protein